jgi:carboxypeptidase family protein
MSKPLLFLLGFALLVAGCSGSSNNAGLSASGSAAPSSVDGGQDTGSIKGTVVSEEAAPIAGAQVAAVRPTTAETKTDESGQFELAGLAAGSYDVVAQALGYNSLARKVDVVAGETSEARFVLPSIEIIVPYNTTTIVKGYWMCDVDIGPFVTNCADFQQFTGPRPDSVSFDIGTGWNTTVFQLTWTPAQSSTDTTPRVYCIMSGQSKKTASTTWGFGEAHGTRPMRLEFQVGQPSGTTILGGSGTAYPEEAYKHSANCYPKGLYSEETATRGVGAIVDTTWTVYASIFYHEAAPKGFSALPPP